jgi:hypothetical protein
MPHTVESEAWYHTNKHTAEAVCEHCNGVVSHEDWCITRNRKVAYAYDIVLHPGKVTIEDQLILHALGVAWAQSSCNGSCHGQQH